LDAVSIGESHHEIKNVNSLAIIIVSALSNDPHLDRSEAIRRLVGLGLTVKTKAKKPSVARAYHAKELATKAIETIIDA
jgi:hypothetical protein